MKIVETFLPIATNLLDNVFASAIIYRRDDPEQVSYDPVSGLVTRSPTDYSINAGVLSMGRSERGEAIETRELRLWIHHGIGGLPFLPLTGDYVTYLGELWKVSKVDPTYAGDALIASRIALDSVPGKVGPPPALPYIVQEDGSAVLTEPGEHFITEA